MFNFDAEVDYIFVLHHTFALCNVLLDVDSITVSEIVLYCFGQFKERIEVIVGARASQHWKSKKSVLLSRY